MKIEWSDRAVVDLTEIRAFIGMESTPSPS